MRRGEVVEVDWTYSDLTGSKVRPAVIVQADFRQRPDRRHDPRADHEHPARYPRNGSGDRPSRRDGVGAE